MVIHKIVLIGMFIFVFTFILPQLTWAQNTNTSSDTLNYKNSTYGISIQYPSSWSIEKESNLPSNTDIAVAGINPPISIDPQSSTYFTINVDSEPSSLNLNQYLRNIIDDYRFGNDSKPDFKIQQDNVTTFVAGKQFYSLTYLWNEESIGQMESIDMGTIIGNKVYYFVFNTESPKFDGFMPIITEMIKSLKVNMPTPRH
jgi:hypothetical protein